MASSIHLHASSFVDREDHLKSLAFIKCSHKKLLLFTACPYISTDPDLRRVPDMDFRDCKIARSHKSLMMVQMICGLFCKKRRQMLGRGVDMTPLWLRGMLVVLFFSGWRWMDVVCVHVEELLDDSQLFGLLMTVASKVSTSSSERYRWWWKEDCIYHKP